MKCTMCGVDKPAHEFAMIVASACKSCCEKAADARVTLGTWEVTFKNHDENVWITYVVTAENEDAAFRKAEKQFEVGDYDPSQDITVEIKRVAE